MNNNVIVSINGVDYIVNKMPLGKIAKALQSLDKIPNIIDKLDTTDNEKIIQQIPSLIMEAFPEFTKLLSIATGVDETIIANEIGLAEATDLIIAVIEVNNFEKVFENIKKMTARTKSNKTVQATNQKS